MRILIAAAEFSPIARESHVADFTASISDALRALGHDVRAIIPLHGCIDTDAFEFRGPLHKLDVPLLGSTSKTSVFEITGPSGIPIFAIENERYFRRANIQGHEDDDERYIFFSKAVVQVLDELNWRPDVIHCVEWNTALVADYIQGARHREIHPSPISVLTLCDLERYTPSTRRGRDEMNSPQLTLNLAARGVLTADRVSVNVREDSRAISKLELLTPSFRERGWQITCIETPEVPAVAGTESREFGFEERLDPMTDPAIHTAFGPVSVNRKLRNKQAFQLECGLGVEPDCPLVGMVCRLDDAHDTSSALALLNALDELEIQLVVRGSGLARYERIFANAAADSPLCVSFRPETPDVGSASARRLFAAADLFLALGREQTGRSIALRYGAIPILSRAAEAPQLPIIGFSFDPETGSLLAAVRNAIEQYRTKTTWSALVQRALLTDPHWKDAAERYELLYRTALQCAAEGRAIHDEPCQAI